MTSTTPAPMFARNPAATSHQKLIAREKSRPQYREIIPLPAVGSCPGSRKGWVSAPLLRLGIADARELGRVDVLERRSVLGARDRSGKKTGFEESTPGRGLGSAVSPNPT